MYIFLGIIAVVVVIWILVVRSKKEKESCYFCEEDVFLPSKEVPVCVVTKKVAAKKATKKVLKKIK